MKSADIRYRTDTPATPTSLTTLFANSSGAVLQILPDGTVKPLAQRAWETTTVASQSCINPTGAYGGTGRWMGQPDEFIEIKGPTGQAWAIPVYLRA